MVFARKCPSSRRHTCAAQEDKEPVMAADIIQFIIGFFTWIGDVLTVAGV